MKMVFVLAAAIAFLASPVIAGDVDFSAIITDADGAPVIDCIGSDCAGKPPLTLGKVALRAVTAIYEDEHSLSGEEKFHRGELAARVSKGGVMALPVEDAALIKRLIAKGYGPLIVFRTWPLLDTAAGK